MSYIKDFCLKYEYPIDAVEELESAYKKLEGSEAFSEFRECIAAYEADYNFDEKPIFEKIAAMSEKVGIHQYTLQLLYLISLTPHLKKLYEREGISDFIYDGSVLDLKWKLNECHKIFGIWGVSTTWGIGFFKLILFALGRLQFNIYYFNNDLFPPEDMGVLGEPFIGIHIPSCGPLNYEECLKSYDMAAEFFSKRYNLKRIVFGCRSWLVSRDNALMLPPDSNIVKFLSDFKVLKVIIDKENKCYRCMFPIPEFPEDVSTLPQETGLQRAFVKRLMEGHSINEAFGVFEYKKDKM